MPSTLSPSLFIVEIVRHTPLWVWAVLLTLVLLGRKQRHDQIVSRTRLVAMPLAMTAWSLWSATSTFGAHGATVVAWALGVALALGISHLLPAPEPVLPRADGRVMLAGSPWPLVGMLTIFALRYVATVTLLLHPQAATGLFGPTMVMLYGALSGAFAARALRSLKAAGFLPRLAALA